MNELIITLYTVVLSMTALPTPEYPPVVQASTYEAIVEKACGSQDICKDIHVYTDPLDNVIYYDNKIDWSYSLAKGELVYELARNALYQHDIYKYTNTCERNIEIEKALVRIRFDFLKIEMDSGRYKGYGVPQINDLPTHIFYCTPPENKLPEVKI